MSSIRKKQNRQINNAKRSNNKQGKNKTYIWQKRIQHRRLTKNGSRYILSFGERCISYLIRKRVEIPHELVTVKSCKYFLCSAAEYPLAYAEKVKVCYSLKSGDLPLNVLCASNHLRTAEKRISNCRKTVWEPIVK